LDSRAYRVNARYLHKKCNPSIFKFKSTAEIEPLVGIIGQDRAVHSLSFGLDISDSTYNIYLAGILGTGRTTLIRELLQKKASSEPVPSDWCYVHNFKNPDSPKAIKLPAGKGIAFKKDVSVEIEKVTKQIVRAFESEDFDYKKNEILNVFVEQTNAMYLQLEEEARSQGFAISRTQSGISTIPLKKNGEALSQEEYMAMPEDERAELMKKSSIVQEKLNRAFRKFKELEKNVKARIKDLEQETARSVTVLHFARLFNKYRMFADIVEYLEDMQQDLLNNIDLFIKREGSWPAYLFQHIDRRASLRRYQVNLIVDNSQLDHAPVIFENNPTYSNLFGQIEYESEFGILATDFSKIKAGSVHKANGGYLIFYASSILKNFYIWETLKKVLKNQEIKVENVTKVFGLSNMETLEPESIPVNLKIVLIGEPIYYYLLYEYDEDFRKLFKIKVDFDVEMDRNRVHIDEHVHFIASVCKNKNLVHFSPRAVAAVIDYSSRLVGDQRKLTTLFNKLVEIIYEADSWAKKEGASIVEDRHVKRAIEEKRYRSAMIEEKIRSHIKEHSLIINVTGEKIGELNGLAVYEMGDYSFGKPVRITAKTFMGEKGLINIEREIRLSGTIHSKGVLTLNGYLGAQYAQDKPLTLSASLTFEQSYQGIEGDSASAAELFALLSSLAEVPIKQGIAVTGSVNQNGEIQPVGGVNQKIEGFFKVCKDQGLDGRQGVIIPRKNIPHLMLDDEVVEAVKSKKFNIWAVDHVNEGLEILTGIEAGERNEGGGFTPGSIHARVDDKLRKWSSRQKSGKYRYNYNVYRHSGPIRRRRRL